MSAPTVLVVEDNPRTRKLLRLTLESEGCAVLEAGDGAEARALFDRVPDLVVMDLLLPDVSGLDLRAEVAAAAGCALTPVIAISGYAQGLEAATSAGFADRLIKPVEPSTLLGAVRRWLPAVDDEPVRGTPRILVADDTELQRKLTVLRLRDCGYDVHEAADGLTAFSLVRARRPDVVLSDVLMPGIDGFELCRRIVADPDLAGTSVVLASSVFVEPADRELASAAGATGYVTREPDLKEVIGAVGRALGASGKGPPAPDAFDRLHADRLGHALAGRAATHDRLERELEERDAQLAVLAGIAETLARTSDPATVLEEILARCVEATGVAGAEYRSPAAAARGTASVRVGEPHHVEEEVIAAAVTEDLPLVTEHGVVIRVGDGHDHDHGIVVLGGGAGTFSGSQIQLCRAIARQLSQALELAQTHADVLRSREQVVERLSLAVSLRDGGTSAHSRRMSLTCEVLAAALGMDDEACRLLRVASAMHDIGKIGVSDNILLKAGPLDPDERAQIERHAEIGHTILAGSGSALLELAATIALSHHERWDGTGYPRGCRGEEIPLEGRVAAVADVFDALVSERPYRPAMTVDEALAIIHAGSGTHFDPSVVAALDATLTDILELVE